MTHFCLNLEKLLGAEDYLKVGSYCEISQSPVVAPLLEGFIGKGFFPAAALTNIFNSSRCRQGREDDGTRQVHFMLKLHLHHRKISVDGVTSWVTYTAQL